MNTNQLRIGSKVQDQYGNIFTVVSEEFINSLENKDKWTCTPAYVKQQINFGQMTILNK